MQFRALNPLLVLSLTLFFAACSGGGLGGTKVRQNCGSSAVNLFCLTSCNLGCSLTGCSINKIHQNEPITLNFSQEVDKFSVPPHTTSILLRTATGEEPVGDWLVNGNTVTFLPGVRISGASTFFGFRPNETYKLHLPAGQQTDVVRSLSGDRLTSSITCSLIIGDIIDLNQVPPFAKLITPSVTSAVVLDTKIVIEFNEIIDPAIFIDITSETSPIRYSVKKTQTVNSQLVCRSSSEATLLPGVPRMSIDTARRTSVVTFVPKEALPGAKCVEIGITSKVRDLAGVPAKAHALSFVTKDVGTQIFSNVEEFKNSQFLDKDRSAGTWGNGKLTFSPIGGSGIHGVFDPSIGKLISPKTSKVAVYEWDTDNMIIPATLTTTGKSITVTDGRFFFQSFEVRDGVEVHFVGSNPVRIWVRGSANIEGLIAANGESLVVTNFPLSGNPNAGEPGGRGGAFGADGGAGGDKGDGFGNKPAFDGKDGQDIILPSGHAYAGQNKGTAGKGVPQWPLSGLKSAIIYSFSSVISTQMNRGAGGAGFRGAGGTGFVKWSAPNAGNQQYAAPGTTPGGIAMAFPPNFPKTYPPGWTHQDHFLVGGSGGGGGGSCCSGAIKGSAEVYRPARAGGGGGGALGMRVGGSLKLAASGRLEARGGDAAQDSAFFTTRNMPTPGGGGSGGSLFLQVNLDVINKGLITVRGGAAGKTEGNLGDTIFKGMLSAGGKGADGILHFETAQDPSSYPVGRTEPASPPIAKLDPNDLDDIVSVRSLWYPASLLFPPDFMRYEIEADIDGETVIFSDDPKVGVLAFGVGSTSPLKFQVQGAKLEIDPSGRLNPKPNTPIKPFRAFVGPHSTTFPSLFDDGATGYRFELTLDRSLKMTVVVKKISVFWSL